MNTLFFPIKTRKIYIGGPGTGKSYTINQMSNTIKIAPTNACCRIINASTIYSLTNSPMKKL